MKILNVLENYMYVYENGNVVKKELKKEKGVVTSFLLPEDILTITKKFSILDEDEILVEMEEYIYSYPTLKKSKDYNIVYNFIRGDDFIIVEALLVDLKLLEKKFFNILKEFKYIDFISPAMLGWGEYYNIKNLSYKNDIFIYFSRDSSFLTAFSNGKYLFHKSLNKFISLNNDIGLNDEELTILLKEKGLDKSKYENIEIFNKVESFFSEFFLKVFNILSFYSNEFSLSKFDRIFFYSPFEINFLQNYYKNYWELNGIEFQLTSLNTSYNHLEYLVTIFNANHYKDEEINFSIFKKPPCFVKTPLGKLFLFVLFLLILSILFVKIEVIKINNLSHKLQEEKLVYTKVLNEKLKFLKRVDNLKEKISFSNKKIVFLEKEIVSLLNKVNILSDKAKTPLFYNTFAKIVKCLKKYNLKIYKLVKDGKNYTIVIKSYSDNTRFIAKFMQDLEKEGFINVTSRIIKNKNGVYISYVKFES